ncbi:MAG: hypothetical protein R3D45_05580 [Rhizobiaceae bacterium]
MNRIITLTLIAILAATGMAAARGGAGGGAGGGGGGGGGGESDRHPLYSIHRAPGGGAAAIGPMFQLDSFSWGSTNDTAPPPPPPSPPPSHDDDCMSCD